MAPASRTTPAPPHGVLDAQNLNDQTHWTVKSDGTAIDVASRAAAWCAATSAYSPGHPVIVSAA